MSTCHVCGSPNSEQLLFIDGDDLRINRCESCGFAYLASWKRSLEQSEELYDYYTGLSDEDLARRYTEENRARQRKLLKQLGRFARGRKLLDVGCGHGQLLQTARDEGWDPRGIDLTDSAIVLCLRRGLSATKTDFFDSSLDGRRFDAIVMSELIEHVPSPQRFLKRAEELLEEDGVLYLTTPNFGSLSRRMLGESWSGIHAEHIGYFDRSTLRQMAAEHTSLREIKIEANNFPPSTIVTWLRRPSAGTVAEVTQAHREARRGLDQKLRRAIHRSRTLATSKEVVNRVISRAGLGDTLVAWLQKPARQP